MDSYIPDCRITDVLLLVSTICCFNGVKGNISLVFAGFDFSMILAILFPDEPSETQAIFVFAFADKCH